MCDSTAHLFDFDLFQLCLMLKWDEMRNKDEKKEGGRGEKIVETF